MTLHDFFARYAELSLGREPETLAPLYAPTFIVGGPEGSQAFSNDGKFLDWLREVARFNREHGLDALTVVNVDDTPLSPLHSLAHVRWGARFARTGSRRIEFEIAYLLERHGEGWRILSYISKEDQGAAMKREGLL